MSHYEQWKKDFLDKSLYQRALDKGLAYQQDALERHVFPTQQALDELDAFDEALPDHHGQAKDILSLLAERGAPATIAQTGGRYFGFVNGSVLPAALAARTMTDYWDQNAALTIISPVTGKIEQVCERWLRELFDLPESTVAGFVGGSSVAIFAGLAAGRWRLFQNLGWDVNEKGLNGAPVLRVIASKHIHATVVKAVTLLGLGQDQIEWVDVDREGRMRVDLLPDLDDHCLVIAQAGNVNSGAFDDLQAIGKRVQAASAWLHIDGAFGLWARGCKKLAYLAQGMELAQSWSLDAHKTLNVPYDNGIILCADRDALTTALHAAGSYIIRSDERDGMYFTPEMSRRARAIDLWAALKYLGRDGVDTLVERLHLIADRAGSLLGKAGFTIPNEVVFNQVLVQCETDELTLKTLENIQHSGTCWCGGAKWFERDVIRLSVCSWVTNENDVDLAVNTFIEAREKARQALERA